ncbi:MAG: trifunctional transcriptional regulator/proline dehydrogenase/L-glutamate gamma-semialdehyde dehydrogenase [Candidatus Arsenophonus melophagi]|nr:trifunctional transcriptional regulator/proline dehydrogenase/L-glutamate gamma-semialdehyde dehydrogenase [Candidatus Arsenophonus melophagi]
MVKVKSPASKVNKKTNVLSEASLGSKNDHPFFVNFAAHILPQSAKSSAITSAYLLPETELLPLLLQHDQLIESESVYQLAFQLAERIRKQKNSLNRSGLVQSLLQQFALSSQEGVALMCLAEALLRIPDKATRDNLILDKISRGDWQSHIGKSSSWFVNVATWSLFFIGKLVDSYNETKLISAIYRIMHKSTKPMIRQAMNMAMRLMSKQFITGETITQALNNAHKIENQGFSYSYDMLGEAALTAEDAKNYMAAYQQAIDAIGKASHGKSIYANDGISIKLSALHPRYCRAQYQRVMDELYPRLLTLTLQARHYDIGINIDAEESDKLEISLVLLKKLCFEPQLAGWNGIGFVIQSYQKRCPYVIDEIIDLAQRSQHRLMIRLVKGAYWDSEIKRAQIEGLEDYPVYSRKIYTDVSYLACANKLLSVPNLIYPQFATHNAHTLASIYHMAGENYYPDQYEFQCLHGMGESLYQQVVGSVADGKLNRPCRIYAPVGSYKTLLAYLVRRLLENGANTSFVNKIADPNIPLDTLLNNPIQVVLSEAKTEGKLGLPHPKIPLPRALYGKDRLNAIGIDLTNEHQLVTLAKTLLKTPRYYQVKPLLGDQQQSQYEISDRKTITNPANHSDIVGYVYEATMSDVEHSLVVATRAAASWAKIPVLERATILQQAATLIEQQIHRLVGVLIREAGKTYSNAIAEVREAIDFLRYYAQQISVTFINESYTTLGVIVCISPWNFPLAIFIGQIAAALASGNSVLAKPAEQTPIIAMLGVTLLHKAGIPRNVLQLLPGQGEKVGTQLISDQRTSGVLFTGSTSVAKLIQRKLSSRLNAQNKPITLIAETGGLNAMIVDSSALTEQVVNDVIISAFDSAGQRCSSLRILCLQEEIAERTLIMLKGAMAEYNIGDPIQLSTDIGPVIDQESQKNIEQHIEKMRQKGKKIYQAQKQEKHEWKKGTFVQPTLIEIEHFKEIKKEIFGPVLHVIRFKRNQLDKLIKQIIDSGYGLTLGLHTRIDDTIAYVSKHAKVGNLYVNRNMVGAIVGVQPFGGEGLSGTGPKAGGPLYLYQLLSQRSDAVIDKVFQQLADCYPLADSKASMEQLTIFNAFCDWAEKQHDPVLNQVIIRYKKLSYVWTNYQLVGPTGEHNSYSLVPRGKILCLAENQTDTLLQLATALTMGCQVIWPNNTMQQQLHAALPALVSKVITITDNWQHVDCQFDSVIFHGDCQQLQIICAIVAERDGPIISVQGYQSGDSQLLVERLVHERAISINTTAAGGNASLMALE